MDIEKVSSSLRAGSEKLAVQNAFQKNKALEAVIASIEKNRGAILDANAKDVEKARAGGMTESLVDRLSLDDKKINGIIDSIKAIIGQTDPVGEEVAGWKTPNGMQIRQVRVPVGVIAIIYESRPNVTADAFCLAYKSGNAILLRGSSSALNSNSAIVAAIKEGLQSEAAGGFGVPEAIELAPCENHEEVEQILTAVGKIDMALPRGGKKLIQMVVEKAKVPVIETGSGICHLYVDEEGDLDMAALIAENGKIQRPGVCNALECIVVNRKIAKDFLPKMAERFAGRVELRCDEESYQVLTAAGELYAAEVNKTEAEVNGCETAVNGTSTETQSEAAVNGSAITKVESAVNGLRECVKQAVEEDFDTEFLDFICAIKTVENVEEAISFINAHNTKHSESIITNNRATAQKFQQKVDASCVYVNASTRFTDGGEFGFGTELGISTQKLHARGPMGIKALTTTKFLIDGDGQIR